MDNHVNPSCFSPVNYLKILIIYISVKILQNNKKCIKHLYTLPINQTTKSMHAVDYVQQVFQQSFDYFDNLEA